MKKLYGASLLYFATFIYLLIPFVLFLLFWIKPAYSILLCSALVYCSFSIYTQLANSNLEKFVLTKEQKRHFLIGSAILFSWLFFSGIGNLAFQNTDFEVRNAILRDLVQQRWPVMYSSAIFSPDSVQSGNNYLFVYYFGYWLPAAGVGKLVGLTGANIFLLVWTFIGLLLVYCLICLYLKKISYAIIIILIFWSGLDVVGTLLVNTIGKHHNDLGFLAHLERWADSLGVHAQFSSNTTLLYWVFNQTIPLWLCIMLVITNRSSSYIFLISTLSLFLAPIGTIGFLPFLIVQICTKVFKKGIGDVVHDYATFPNIVGAAIVFFITLLFFTANKAGSLKSLISFDPIEYSIFFLLEVGILSALLIVYSRDQRKLIAFCTLLLFVIPFIKLGHLYDFGMRASIAYLFLLTISTIRFLLSRNSPGVGKFIVLIYLCVGAITPLLEINRSVFFTSSHALFRANEWLKESHHEQFIPGFLRAKIKDRPFLCDPIKTLNKYNPTIIIDQFVGQSSGTLFADYLLNKPKDSQPLVARQPTSAW